MSSSLQHQASSPEIKYRILLLEDDEQLASLIVQFLLERQCSVFHAANGNDFMKAIHHRHYDLIISDVVLPDASGFKLLDQFRRQINCPLIFLSALSSVEDQVTGLKLGANDYLVKPVDPHLLWAKIEASLRAHRTPPPAHASICFGPLTIDLVTRQVKVGHNELALTTTEFDLLHIFAEQPTRLLSREYLFRRMVGREFDGQDRVIDVRISRLRKKLDAVGDGVGDGVVIHSIRGRGYSLNATSGNY